MQKIILVIFIFVISKSFASSDLSSLVSNLVEVISAESFEMPSYEQAPAMVKRRYTKAQYAQLVNIYNEHYKKRSFEINYLSDGLKVKGIIILPPQFSSSKKYPAIIYNRGGNRDFGKVFATNKLAKQYADYGYIVFASQYRGVDGGEGKEEFGGKDINDVLGILKVAKKLPFIDGKNTFMIGASRGGMMTYLALKKGANINAAVSLYGVSDLFLTAQNRPEMESRVFNHLIPNIFTNRSRELEKRSALFWADKIEKPLLLLHGDDDWRVSHEHSVLLKDELERYEKRVRLRIFPGGKHGLRKESAEVLKEIHSWLELHKK